MSLCIIIANIPNKSTPGKKTWIVSTKIDEACSENAICFQWGRFFRLRLPLQKYVCGWVSAPCPTTAALFALKGIGDISMWDELPQITSPQRWCDIVGALPHYYNVTDGMVRNLRMLRGMRRGDLTAGIGSRQMSWLIKRSSIKVIEMQLSKPRMGGRQEGGHLQSLFLYSSTWSDISTPANSWSHTAGRISASLRASDSGI